MAQCPKRRVGPSTRVTRPDPERLGSLPSETKETEEAHGREGERESVVVWGRDLRTEAYFSVFLLGIFFFYVSPRSIFSDCSKERVVGNAVEARSDEIRASGVGHGSAHV